MQRKCSNIAVKEKNLNGLSMSQLSKMVTPNSIYRKALPLGKFLLCQYVACCSFSL